MAGRQIHFVTGRLAAGSLRDVVQPLAESAGFHYTIQVMPITVAALMTPAWIAKRLELPPESTEAIIPGYCEGPLEPLQSAAKVPVHRGPRDLRALPEFFGQQTTREDYGDWDIQILAEINHAPRLSRDEILQLAHHYRDCGADLVDVGCHPQSTWDGVAECVRMLQDHGFRVSIDSLNPAEIEPAVKAGAELVLSVNSSNREAAIDWGCEVVAIPDDPKTLAGLDETVDHLASAGVPVRLDAVLEPIGFGFAESLGRYLEIRRRYPDAEMMMGIGNLTELTDADSAAINVLLLGICQELGIRSVLTTEVIPWAQSSVQECDLARRLVHYAVRRGMPPKHLEPDLVLLRDPRRHEPSVETLEELAARIRDPNYRLFIADGRLHLVSAGLHLADGDPFRLFDQLLAHQPKNLDASHSFYLGYELAKATIARTLGKHYEQDEALGWGFLTEEETGHRLTRRRPDASPPPS